MSEGENGQEAIYRLVRRELSSQLFMPGLPIIDELYFAHPSIRLGGWIAFHMKRRGVPYMNFVAGQDELVETPVIHRDSLGDALAEIEAEDKTKTKGHYYYRGQAGRRELQCSCEIPRLGEAFPDLSRPTFKFESFVPSSFRSYISRPPAGTVQAIRWPAWKPQSPLAGVGIVARALMESHNDALSFFVRKYLLDVAQFPEIIMARTLAMRRMALTNPPPPHLLAPGTNVLKSLLTLISWAQHYEFGSIMVDISSSPRVAAWFASHRWSGEVARDDQGQGVIYRFNYVKIRQFLEKELDRETPAAPLIRALGFLGLTDISDLPVTGGKRPSAQCGGSFLGLENIIVAYLFSVYGGLTIYTFPLRSVSGLETAYTKNDLCPADDAALSIFPAAAAAHEPLTPVELKRFVDCDLFTKDQQGFLVRSFEEGLL